MTNREFLTAVSTLECAPATLREEALARIEKLDAANSTRKNKPSKAQIENAPLLNQIYDEVLTDEPMVAADVAAMISISTQKASALLRQLVAAGRAEVTDVKVTGKSLCKGYTKVESTTPADVDAD